MHRTERAMRRQVCEWLVANGLTPVFEVILAHACDFIGVAFTPDVRPPQIARGVAIELKLDDVASVLRQCVNNRFWLPSYAAIPSDRCKRMRSVTLDKFRNTGVGLLAVDLSVSVVVEASLEQISQPNQSLAKKLWRRRNEWADRLDQWEKQHQARI